MLEPAWSGQRVQTTGQGPDGAGVGPPPLFRGTDSLPRGSAVTHGSPPASRVQRPPPGMPGSPACRQRGGFQRCSQVGFLLGHLKRSGMQRGRRKAGQWLSGPQPRVLALSRRAGASSPGLGMSTLKTETEPVEGNRHKASSAFSAFGGCVDGWGGCTCSLPPFLLPSLSISYKVVPGWDSVLGGTDAFPSTSASFPARTLPPWPAPVGNTFVCGSDDTPPFTPCECSRHCT